MSPTISVILPVFNESETLDKLKERLTPVLEESVGGSFEVLFVDDGSRDGSDRIIDGFHERDPRFKAIHFSRNFGHQAALQAGLDAALGGAVALMDADLQDPPELLEQFIEYWRQGYDVVYAVRKKRKEAFWKRAAYNVFYRSMKAISEIEVPLDAGDFCLIDRRVVETLVSLRERNRFLRGLRSWVGFKQIGVEFERDARHAGEPKYTLRKLMGVGFVRLHRVFGNAVATGHVARLGLGAKRFFSRPVGCMHEYSRNLQPTRLGLNDSRNYVHRRRPTYNARRDWRIPQPRL
jgi:polyisoprenyl-phosphate glycosyltransferase